MVSVTKLEEAWDETAHVELKLETSGGPRLEVHVAVVALTQWQGLSHFHFSALL